MPKIATYISLGIIHLDRTRPTPLHRQLYDNLQEAILSGLLRPGIRLPPTRAMAQELGVSRNTVSNAYNQLLTEGYLESKVGAGTYVTSSLPEESMRVSQPTAPLNHNGTATQHSPLLEEGSHTLASGLQLSERGRAIADLPINWERSRPTAFDPALPALDLFPTKLWEKLLVTGWRDLAQRDLGYRSAQGYLPLREALVTYLQTARGVRCSADNIIITNGAQQAVTLIANLLLDKGDRAWVEDPCYPGIIAALRGVLAEIVPVAIDAEGLSIADGIAKAADARLAYISPSHQYPLGVMMSLTRRLNLLQWAQDNSAWIVEDDYDSVFRYAGYPTSAVQGLDKLGRVIYVGTFSKVLYPALRTGYMVVPDELIAPFHAARAHADRGNHILEQAVLTRFIDEGHLARHVRKMRTSYAGRQAVFIEEAERYLTGLLDVSATDAGLHLVGWLPDGADDQKISAELRAHGLIAPALSSFALSPTATQRGGLVLGFAAVPKKEIPMAVKRMWGILEQTLS